MSEINQSQLQPANQTHFNIEDYLKKLEIMEEMPNPQSYSQPESDYDIIRKIIKESITKMKYFIDPNAPLNIWFDNLKLMYESETLKEQKHLMDLISPFVTPEFTYIRPFFKYDENENKNYGKVPLTKNDFIFIVINSILEHYTWKKPELIQTINNSLRNKNTGGLFSCLNFTLARKKKALIFKIIQKLYEFGTEQGIPRKQFPTEETIKNKTNIFTFMNTLFISGGQNGKYNGPVIHNAPELIKFGQLICDKADPLISSKEKADYDSYGPLLPYVLIARQLAEAFHVSINLLILEMNAKDPNSTSEWINLNTTEATLISSLNIFLTKDLGFAGKLIFQKYWNSEKIYNDLMQIKSKTDFKSTQNPWI